MLQSSGSRTSRVAADGTTGTISNSTRSLQDATHCCSRRASSHSISWKQRSKLASTQLSTWRSPLRNAAASIVQPSIDGLGVTVLEPLDHHEQHRILPVRDRGKVRLAVVGRKSSLFRAPVTRRRHNRSIGVGAAASQSGLRSNPIK
jgi:hypothetical protein